MELADSRSFWSDRAQCRSEFQTDRSTDLSVAVLFIWARPDTGHKNFRPVPSVLREVLSREGSQAWLLDIHKNYIGLPSFIILHIGKLAAKTNLLKNLRSKYSLPRILRLVTNELFWHKIKFEQKDFDHL